MQTKKMTVHENGMGFLIDRLGADCSPLQYLRELTHNSIEAFTRHKDLKGDHQIIWCRDELWYQNTGIEKLCIIDNGVGMDAEELVKYVNALSSSGGSQSMASNYGMGAKIAAATVNHYGVIYQSWKNGVGHMIWLWKDDKTGGYGLAPINDKVDKDNPYVQKLPPESKPEVIDQHGTKVILLGNHEESNTWNPTGMTPKYQWIPIYLNNKYYELPDIKIKLAGKEITKSGSTNWLDRNIYGMKYHLNKESVKSGTMELSDVKIHWWILPKGGLTGTRAYCHSGHVAAIYQNELYDFKQSRLGLGMLSQFGVVFGAKRVVIYAEPQTSVTTDTARSTLKMDNLPLPWEEWANLFSQNIPKEIEEMQAEERGETSNTNPEDLARLLSTVKSFYDLKEQGLKRKQEGLHKATAGSDSPTTEIGDSPSAGRSGKGLGGGRRPRINNPYAPVDFTGSGDNYEMETVDVKLPTIDWIDNPEEFDLEGFAAKYISSKNTIIVNRMFPGFIDLHEKVSKTVAIMNPTTSQSIKESIEKWYGLTLAEAVLGVKGIRDLDKWSIEQRDNALSPEALTTLCMQRYYQLTNIKREIGKFKIIS